MSDVKEASNFRPKFLYVAFGKQDWSVWWVLKEKKKKIKGTDTVPLPPPTEMANFSFTPQKYSKDQRYRHSQSPRKWLSKPKPKPNFPFNNEEIDDTDPTDDEESSQELEQDVSTWSRGISNLGGLCLRRVEHFGGLPRKLLSKDNFSPFDSLGVYPSSLLESLFVLKQHKSWAGLWSMCDYFKHGRWWSSSATRRLLIDSLSIRRFWGKGERWKRKRERAEGEKPSFLFSPSPLPHLKSPLP